MNYASVQSSPTRVRRRRGRTDGKSGAPRPNDDDDDDGDDDGEERAFPGPRAASEPADGRAPPAVSKLLPLLFIRGNLLELRYKRAGPSLSLQPVKPAPGGGGGGEGSFPLRGRRRSTGDWRSASHAGQPAERGKKSIYSLKW